MITFLVLPISIFVQPNNCILKGGLDFYIVEMSAIYEKGMTIFVPDQKLGGFLEKVYEGEDMEAIYNPNKYRKTNATIVAVPRAMSNEVVETLDAGFPQPKGYIGHDRISEHERMRGSRPNGYMWPALTYNPATYEPKCLTMKDLYIPRFKEGYTLHFYWTATMPENMVECEKLYGQQDDSGQLAMRYVFKINPTLAVCATDGDNIYMNDRFVLIEKIMQTEDEIKTSSGIYTQAEVKAKELVGIIRHSNDFHTGCMVKFLPSADYEMTINGKEYYAMKQDEITVLLIEDKMVPIDDMVLIFQEKPREFTDAGLFIPEEAREPINKGIVISIGNKCEYVAIGDYVMFGLGCGLDVVHGTEKYLKIAENDIMCQL